MTDREKVIKGLEHCDFGVSSTCYEKECPYYQSHDCTDELKNDILVLLKEQEAVEPILKREGRNKYYNYYVCPCCDEEVVYDQNYCSECGAKFMWEGR